MALIPQLRAFARSLTGDSAQGDDLAQDALAKAWASQQSFEPGTNLKAWAFTILRNHFYSIRRRDRRSVPLEQDVAERTLTVHDDPAGPLQLDELRRALAMLGDDQREALILVGAAGLSYEQVAVIMGVPAATIKSRVS